MGAVAMAPQKEQAQPLLGEEETKVCALGMAG